MPSLSVAKLPLPRSVRTGCNYAPGRRGAGRADARRLRKDRRGCRPQASRCASCARSDKSNGVSPRDFKLRGPVRENDSDANRGGDTPRSTRCRTPGPDRFAPGARPAHPSGPELPGQRWAWVRSNLNRGRSRIRRQGRKDRAYFEPCGASRTPQPRAYPPSEAGAAGNLRDITRAQFMPLQMQSLMDGERAMALDAAKSFRSE